MNDLLSGIIISGYTVSGLFFLRFWRDTHDRLFAIFAGAFWLLAVQRVLLAVARTDGTENVSYLYVLRLIAFVAIIIAILDKNRTPSS